MGMQWLEAKGIWGNLTVQAGGIPAVGGGGARQVSSGGTQENLEVSMIGITQQPTATVPGTGGGCAPA